MSEIEEMENTMDEAIEAANEVNNILAQSGEGNGAVAESGTDGDPVLTTEQKKKAINLQDLIYIKKYIQNMAASLKSEVEGNAEAAYLKKTDAETTYLKKTDAAVGATKLADSNGAMKLNASSTDNNILPATSNGSSIINLGNETNRLRHIYSDHLDGEINGIEFKKNLSNGMHSDPLEVFAYKDNSGNKVYDRILRRHNIWKGEHYCDPTASGYAPANSIIGGPNGVIISNKYAGREVEVLFAWGNDSYSIKFTTRFSIGAEGRQKKIFYVDSSEQTSSVPQAYVKFSSILMEIGYGDAHPLRNYGYEEVTITNGGAVSITHGGLKILEINLIL